MRVNTKQYTELEVGAYSVNAINLFVADAIVISLVYCSVAEPEPVEPKLFGTWSRSRN